MERLLRLLNATMTLGPTLKVKLELLVLSRIARELDRSASRIEVIRNSFPGGPSIHSRVVNASMQVKVAAGNLKIMEIPERF